MNEILVALPNQPPRTALKLGYPRFWGDSEKSELSAVEPRLFEAAKKKGLGHNLKEEMMNGRLTRMTIYCKCCFPIC